jgi:hypothetical protein
MFGFSQTKIACTSLCNVGMHLAIKIFRNKTEFNIELNQQMQ